MASHAPHASQARRSFYTHDEDDNLTDEQRTRRARLHRVLVIIKITIFVLIWIFFSIFMIITPPYEPHEIVVSLDPNELRSVDLAEKPTGKYIYVKLKGKIDEDATYRPNRAGKNQSYVIVSAASFDSGTNRTLWSANDWKVYLDDSEKYKVATVKKNFDIKGFDSKSLRAMDTHHDEFEEEAEERVMRASGGSDSPLKVSLLNKDDKPTALSVTANPNPLDVTLGVMYAMLLLCFLYALIIFDIADRTFAALLAASTGIGILCMLGERPSLEQIISWIDMDTLMLLFGMMIMVAVLAETGVFDYMSVFAYHLSKGQPWVLIFLLCMLTVMLSAFLDNVTIIMLMVPVIIRLTECMGLRTTTVLITVALFSNIGGALTPVGDPPNVIIATNPYVVAEGVDFITFVAHMFPGVFFSIVVAWIFIFVVLRNRLFVGSDEQMRESIKNLTKTAAKFNEPRPSDEKMRRDILQRIEELKEQYRRKEVAKTFGLQPASNFIETLAEMEARYKIRNKPLLIKCCIALVFAVLLFLMHSLPFMRGVTLAWAAMLAAMLLLILANKPDMDAVLDHVEWSTLLFFAGLFVLVEVVSELGLIDWVGDLTIDMIQSVGNEHRVVTAIMLVLWISAVFSAFVDNIPIVTMMLKLAIKLSTNDELNLPLMPLIWAISMGVCFGGNGTLIAASSNVVAAGIANQHGYKITFMEFFIYGFPVMLLSDVVATIYLLIAHGLFTWH
ncbi:P protein [Drosophila sulfurigaster albostrigata]|uniref:P protein n=1 Tax=Drosophila sulfurigaster albostrigata TaxID=89887 RepID=UPI002D21C47C|nr:P protein [Drosophila sulfurigaster albostrigata]